MLRLRSLYRRVTVGTYRERGRVHQDVACCFVWNEHEVGRKASTETVKGRMGEGVKKTGRRYKRNQSKNILGKHLHPPNPHRSVPSESLTGRPFLSTVPSITRFPSASHRPACTSSRSYIHYRAFLRLLAKSLGTRWVYRSNETIL